MGQNQSKFVVSCDESEFKAYKDMKGHAEGSKNQERASWHGMPSSKV